jgi:hypothetical protein
LPPAFGATFPVVAWNEERNHLHAIISEEKAKAPESFSIFSSHQLLSRPDGSKWPVISRFNAGSLPIVGAMLCRL